MTDLISTDDSSISIMIQIDQVRWSPMMDEAVEVLLRSCEYPDDEVLVALARAERIAEKACRVVRRAKNDPARTGYASVQIGALQAHLAQTKSTFTTQVLQNSEPEVL